MCGQKASGSMSDTNINPERLDELTSARLAKLAARPVDLSRLDAMLKQQLPDRPNRSRRWLGGMMQPLRIAAAGIAAIGVATIVFLMVLSQPVTASANAMEELHRSIIRGDDGTVQVASLAEAGRVLRESWPSGPDMPVHAMPQGQVMHCCVHEVGRKKMACVAMNVDGVPVSMAVAEARDVKMPRLQTIERDGVSYLTQSSGTFSMVMTQRDGRWLCVMGELPTERLLILAEGMEF